MKVRCVRTNGSGLEIPQSAIEYYDFMYDRVNAPENKKYRPGIIGYESHVYAIDIRCGHVSYYVRAPDAGYIYHCPAICFEVIDARTSSYWHFSHGYVEGRGKGPLSGIYPMTRFAIKEWIEEPRFLEFFVDGQQREVEIMEKAARLIETEFDQNL